MAAHRHIGFVEILQTNQDDRISFSKMRHLPSACKFPLFKTPGMFMLLLLQYTCHKYITVQY